MEQTPFNPWSRMLLKPPPPLVIDLDGTLICTDTFHEMMLRVLYEKPWMLIFLPFWFLKGRPYAKTRLMQSIALDPASLPYNHQFLEFAHAEAKKGRPLILATGTPQKLAENVANHVGIFQDVIGSTDRLNMTGLHKQKALLDRFGRDGFDYAGDSRKDLHVWKVARKALVVRPQRWVLKPLKDLGNNEEFMTYFPRDINRTQAFLMILRPLFWLCNLMAPSLISFMALCLFTSGLFIAGDLLTVYADRKYPSALSVFAQGHLSLITAFYLIPCLLFPSLLLTPELSLYVPFFMGLDLMTRPLSDYKRWGILTFVHLLVLYIFFR